MKIHWGHSLGAYRRGMGPSKQLLPELLRVGRCYLVSRWQTKWRQLLKNIPPKLRRQQFWVNPKTGRLFLFTCSIWYYKKQNRKGTFWAYTKQVDLSRLTVFFFFGWKKCNKVRTFRWAHESDERKRSKGKSMSTLRNTWKRSSWHMRTMALQKHLECCAAFALCTGSVRRTQPRDLQGGALREHIPSLHLPIVCASQPADFCRWSSKMKIFARQSDKLRPTAIADHSLRLS